MFGNNQQAASYERVMTAVAAQPEDIRAKFISAVYGLLSISVILAIAGAWMSASYFAPWVAQNFILMIVLYIGTILGAFLLRHKKPINMIMMFSFTFISGVFIGPVAVVYPGPALSAGITTGVVFLSLTAYARISKKDFSFLSGLLTTGLIAIIVVMLLNSFFLHSSALGFGVSVAGVLLFCGFILYDTSQIMKRYPPEEYISATLALYLDILNLFMFLLRIFIAFDD